MNEGYSALHHLQEHFENAAQAHQRAAYEEVQTAAALATSGTAAQMISSFRNIEKNAEANFSQQQIGLFFRDCFRVSSGTQSTTILSGS